MAIEIEDLNNMEKEAIVISDLSSDEIEDIHVEDIINIPLIKGDKGDKGEKGEDCQGTGDMLASTYDKNGNGIVDNAE